MQFLSLSINLFFSYSLQSSKEKINKNKINKNRKEKSIPVNNKNSFSLIKTALFFFLFYRFWGGGGRGGFENLWENGKERTFNILLLFSLFGIFFISYIKIRKFTITVVKFSLSFYALVVMKVICEIFIFFKGVMHI